MICFAISPPRQVSFWFAWIWIRAKICFTPNDTNADYAQVCLSEHTWREGKQSCLNQWVWQSRACSSFALPVRHTSRRTSNLYPSLSTLGHLPTICHPFGHLRLIVSILASFAWLYGDWKLNVNRHRQRKRKLRCQFCAPPTTSSTYSSRWDSNIRSFSCLRKAGEVLCDDPHFGGYISPQWYLVLANCNICLDHCTLGLAWFSVRPLTILSEPNRWSLSAIFGDLKFLKHPWRPSSCSHFPHLAANLKQVSL